MWCPIRWKQRRSRKTVGSPHPYGIYGSARPAKMRDSTALSRPSLIRMRSQVQVLAGPPPIVAGQSAAGSELGALAAGLGRAGAARPSPPAPPWAPGSAHPAGRLGDDHPPWSLPQPRTAATRHAATSRCRLLPCPPRRRPRGALRTPAWPAWSLSGQARPPRPAPTRRPRSATDLPLANATSAASPASRPPRPSSSRRRPGSHRASTGSGGQGRPASSTWSPTPPPEHGRRRTRPDGRGRQQTAGHRRVDSGRPTAGPSGRRPQVTGHRAAGQPDPGHRNRMGGHRLLDNGDRRRGVSAGRVDHGDDARPPR
jgi:hypothetical protein